MGDLIITEKRYSQQTIFCESIEPHVLTIMNAFYILLIHKKKVLHSRKFSTSSFLMDLFVLKCHEHDLSIYRKCLSVDLSDACMSPKFCGHCVSRTNARKFMKLCSVAPWYNFVLIRFWCYRLRNSDVIWNFWFLKCSVIEQNCMILNLIRFIVSQSFLNSKHLFIIAIVKSYTILYVWGKYTLCRGGE